MKKHGLGRVAKIDLRDHAYALPKPRRMPAMQSRTWYASGVWDQGQTPECVAYSSLKWLAAGPVSNKAKADMTDGFYQSCKKIDGITGDGTTVRAACQILQEHGFINTYHWAFDVPTAAAFILTTGPMVFGTVWTNGMFDPDSRGFLSAGPDMTVAGGHAYLAIGVDTRKKCPDGSTGAFRILNSWGSGWGQNGRVWMPFSLASMLFKEDGEAACSMELKASNFDF